MNCLDCNPEGGDGPRCPKHEVEYLIMEIENNIKRIREIVLEEIARIMEAKTKAKSGVKDDD